MVNSEDFGKRLQKIMDEYELNATNFADEIDVGRSSISHILSGRNKPSLEFVMKVIEAFPEVELYWLLNGKGTFPKKKSDNVILPDSQKGKTLFDVDNNDQKKPEYNQQIQEKVAEQPVLSKKEKKK